MLQDPDIVPYPPADYTGAASGTIARYKRFCSGAQAIQAGAVLAAAASLSLM